MAELGKFTENFIRNNVGCADATEEHIEKDKAHNIDKNSLENLLFVDGTVLNHGQIGVLPRTSWHS